MAIALRSTPFDPWAEIGSHLDGRPELKGKYGATALFIGTMRDLNQGHSVQEMTLEHYPGMTERELERIEGEVRAAWSILDALTVHRVGRIAVDEPIVLVAVWSVHRADAFGACRDLMEALKTRAPFWKRETTETGPRWVYAEAEGDQRGPVSRAR